MSATESSRGDDVHDSSDNESTRGKLLVMAGERCYNIRIGWAKQNVFYGSWAKFLGNMREQG